ncbi:MAG: polysaccharide biosynthesis tyrosine autokinase [Bacteroidetes bacterium]|nr:polysaccharide biosynthesis tyrosine autokinase [Bacteroidota bacterium]
MELKYYISILKRWAWLLILGLILGAAGGYGGSLYQTAIYQTATRVLVMAAPQQSSSDLTYLNEQQLTQTYMQLLTTTPILEGTSVRLGYEVYAKQIKVQQSQNTQIIEITVEDSNPQHAVDIANSLVTVLLEESEKLQAGRYTTMEESLQAQITQMENQIADLESQVEQISTKSVQNQLKDVEAQMVPLQEEVLAIQQEIAKLQPPSSQSRKLRVAEFEAQLAEIQPLLDLYQQIYSNLVVLGTPSEIGNNNPILTQSQATLALYQQIYANLLDNMESVRLARLQNTPSIVQVETASYPDKPIRPKPLSNIMLAGAVGLMLAAGIVFLIEYLDDTLKTPDDIQRYLNLPVLGYIAEMKVSDKSAEALYVSKQPRSPVTEAFRALRTNLEFAGIDKPLHSLLVTSPGPSEGKTTTASNLAAIIAQGDRKVTLLDADMRRPRVHRFLSLPNQVGLSDLFRGTLRIEAVMRVVDGSDKMRAITSGNLPPNPAELLGSTRMDKILNEITSSGEMVIIDSPPSLVSDGAILSAKVDGVILVLQPGNTDTASAVATLEQLQRAGARVLGVVLNRIPRNRAEYYGGYSHYSSYYQGYSYYADAKEA